MYQLQRLQQRDKIVEEYRQKMKILILRASIKERPEVTIVRFQSGLNLKIRDRVKLLPYKDLDDLVQLCVRVEQQLKRRCTSRKVYPNTSSSWKAYPNVSYSRKEYKREGYASKTGYEGPKSKEKEKERETYRKYSSKQTRTR